MDPMYATVMQTDPSAPDEGTIIDVGPGCLSPEEMQELCCRGWSTSQPPIRMLRVVDGTAGPKEVVEAHMAAEGLVKIEEPKVEEPKVEQPKVEAPVEELVVEQPRAKIDLGPLADGDVQMIEIHNSDLMLEALLQFDAGTAVDYIREFGVEHLLLSPVLWSKLAPGQQCSQKSPAWFPGTKAQFIAFSRARSGRKTRCVLTTALADYMTGQAARDEALEMQFAAQTAQHEQTRHHIDQALERRFGPTAEIEDGDTRATITSKFQKRRAQLKLEEVAVRNMLVAREEEEKKRKRADSKGSRSSKSSKSSKV